MDQKRRNDRAASSSRIGMAMVMLGGLTLGVGLVQTTSAGDPPNKQCTGETEFISRWDWANDPSVKGGKGQSKDRWVLRQGSSHAGPDDRAARNSGTWSSSGAVAAVVIVSEPKTKDARWDPAVTSGGYDNTGLGTKHKSSELRDLERLVFCGPAPAPATTAVPTQAPTSAPTTEAPTSAPTTEAPTTEAPTSAPTTEDTTTTSAAVESTSTTEAPAETTTTEVDGDVAGVTTTTDPTASTAPSTTVSEGMVMGSTTIVANDDPRVAGAVQARGLAVTGSTSAPLIALGTTMLLIGGAMVGVIRLREQRAQA